MTAMNQFVQKWRQKRQMGKQAFVLRYGVILIGMSLTIIFTALDFIFNGELSMSYLVARILILPTIGSILVSQRWESNEKKYHKFVTHP